MVTKKKAIEGKQKLEQLKKEAKQLHATLVRVLQIYNEITEEIRGRP